MTIIERIELAIAKGWTCNPETGQVYSHLGTKLTGGSKGYIRLSVWKNGRSWSFGAHQFLWYWVNKSLNGDLMIDHINGNRSDNRIVNLRQVTTSQNNMNVIGVTGITYDKDRNKWRSRIAINNKQIFLGRFNTEEEAKDAYIKAKAIYHKIPT